MDMIKKMSGLPEKIEAVLENMSDVEVIADDIVKQAKCLLPR